MALSEDNCRGEEVDAEGCGAMMGATDLGAPETDAAGVGWADGGADTFSEGHTEAAAGVEVVPEGTAEGGLIAAKYISCEMSGIKN